MDAIVKKQITKNKSNQSAAEAYILQKYRDLKRGRGSQRHTRCNPSKNVAKERTSGLQGIAKFREAVRIVKTFINVCNRLIQIAAEHGKYKLLAANASVKLHSAAAAGSIDGVDNEQLLFDPAMYKSRSEASIPQWVLKVCRQNPEERSDPDLRKLCCLLKQIEFFQKYTKGMLILMAKSATYARFERGRVIIRKGHTGRSVYVVFNGSVALLQDESDETKLGMGAELENDCDNDNSKFGAVLKRGDCFGREALFKATERHATVVCLSTTQFLIIDLDDISGLGLHEYLIHEGEARQNFLKSLPVFEALSDDSIRILAEKSQTYEYLADKVIENDAKSSDVVYICRKGQCNVLRKLKKAKRKLSDRRQSTSIAEDAVTSFLPLTVRPSVVRARTRCLDVAMRAARSRSLLSCNSVSTATVFSNNTRRSLLLEHPGQSWSRLRSLASQAYNGILSQESVNLQTSNLQLESDETVMVKVAEVLKGDLYGARFKNGDKVSDDRNFFLVSCGCELIAIKKSTLIHVLNRKTIEKLQGIEKQYACDEELYAAFNEQTNWTQYRARVVNNLNKWQKTDSKNRSESF